MVDPGNLPIWDDYAELPRFGPLTATRTVDVAVVGAGVSGLTTALLLADAGCRVALVDRRRIGGVDTAHTTAHLTAVVDTDLVALANRIGRDHARAVWDAGFAAMHQIEALVCRHGIDCELRRVPGFRHVPFDASDEVVAHDLARLRDEALLAHELGFEVTMIDTVPLVQQPGWRIDHQALFHPRKYLAGLLRRLIETSVEIYDESEAIIEDDIRQIRCGHGTIRASHVVMATHNPIPGRLSALGAAFLQTRLALYTTYAQAAEVPAPRPAAEYGLYWDTANPYRYVRAEPFGDRLRLIAGGEDQKTGQEPNTESRAAALAGWANALAPSSVVTHRWSGQVIETIDGLPFIGEASEGQWVATGFAGNGMTFGTLSAMIIRDAIVGDRVNPWRELFDINRSAVARGPVDYLRENADYPYYLVRDRLLRTPADLAALSPGGGGLVRVDGRLMAASRDADGDVTLVSPVCTHLGCLVQWNGADRTWDCPCHGSRFDRAGEVLAGPATAPLARGTPEEPRVEAAAASAGRRSRVQRPATRRG